MSTNSPNSNAWRLFQRVTETISKASQCDLPTDYYRYSVTKCWKCHKPILVFTWPEHDEMYPDAPPPTQPLPRTLKHEYSNSIEDEYWVNTCPYCDSIQGDFYMYMEPDGPFFAFRSGEEGPEAFRSDLRNLADYAMLQGLLEITDD
jgi:hypothetical protein